MRFDWLTTCGLFVALVLFAPYLSAAPLPRPDHIVIVVEENKSFQQIIGQKSKVGTQGIFTDTALSTGMSHATEQNYRCADMNNH